MRVLGTRRSTALVGALTLAIAASMALCAAASAVVVHPYLGSFGPDGTSATAFGRPGAVAVDQSSGDVYVADTAAGAIYKFGPEGEPVDFAALGSNKLEGLAFSAAEPGLVELAVDSTTHDIYAVENAPVNAISVFHADGEPAEFSALGSHTLGGFGELCGVAVDSEGDIYAADYEGGISVFAPSGEALTTAAAAQVCGLAVGPGGSLYANAYQGGVSRLEPSTYPVTPATTYDGGTVVDPQTSFGIAVDPTTGDLYADERDAIAQFDAAGTLLGSSGTGGEGALGESEGVAVDAAGKPYATAPTLGSGGANLVARYGAGETEQPRVEATWAAPVGDLEATLNAKIDPIGIAATYHFEYGAGPCSAGGCTASPEASLGGGSGALTVSLPITGLQPSHTYSFRVVVTTAAGSRPSVERTFRTYPSTTASGGSLPDERAYELVSTGPDNSAQLGVPGPTAGFISGGVLPQRAAVAGDAFAFPSWTAFGSAVASPNASFYVARRSAAGWTTENITPPDESRGSVGPIRGFTGDLGTAAIVANSVLAPGAVPGYPNLYLRDETTGALTALTTSQPAFAAPDEYCVNYVGASADGRHVIFAASGGLTPNAPAPSVSDQPNLYEWTPEAGIRLVSVLPDGTAASTGTLLGFGPGEDACLIDGGEITRNPISADGRHIFWSSKAPRALYARVDGTRTIQLDATQGGAGPDGGGIFLTASADGSRVFFNDPNPLVPGAGQGARVGVGGDLYEYRFDTGRLTDLTPPPASEPSEVLGLLGASEDGSYVYFVAEGALRPGAKAGAANLYLDHDGSLSFLARLSRAEDGADWNGFKRHTASVSPNGRHLAFVSVEPLTGYENGLATGGACRLAGDGGSEGGSSCDEVYLYDAEGNRLSCASCNPTGSAPTGPVKPTNGTKNSQLNTLPGWTTPFEEPRYLSEDGTRLFFLSEEGLLPADTNGRQDVYEFERPGSGDCSLGSPDYLPRSEGCLALISSGRSTVPSYFLDASANGDDAFFSTDQALVPGDGDAGYDIYDARVDGVSSTPTSHPAECMEEGCRSGTAAPPREGAITTAGAEGGNVMPRCRKGEVRRAGHCQRRGRQHRHPHRRKQKHGHGTKRGGRR